MATLNLLYQKEYEINDSIKIVIPSVGEIIDNEDNYYNLVTALTATPVDLLVQLDDMGIDFTEINDYDLFRLLFPTLQKQETRLIFGNSLDLNDFEMYRSSKNNSVELYDSKHDITIDRLIHNKIASVLRKIHHLEKNIRRPANKEAKEYMIRRAREKALRNRNRKQDSQIESLIVAMVNTEQYKYDFEGTRELSIYQFNECVRQVIKKIDYDNKMHGVYAGTINAKSLSPADLNWLAPKQSK